MPVYFGRQGTGDDGLFRALAHFLIFERAD